MKKEAIYRICLICLIFLLLLTLTGCVTQNAPSEGNAKTETPDVSAYLSRIAELEAEISAMREQQYISDLQKKNEEKKNPTAPSTDTVEEKAVFHYRAENGFAYITGYEGNVTMVTLPAVLDGYPVRGIDDRAFEGAEFTTLTLPQELQTIGWFAFYDCKQLIEISIPAGVLQIGYGAFDGCERIRVVCPAGSYAEQYAKSYGLNVTNG